MIKAVLPLLLLMSLSAFSQDLPFREIPAYPQSYSGATVAARMVDGLGFRYYWATEGLRQEDLNFEPANASGEARTSFQTLEHIHALSLIVLNAVMNKVNDGSETKPAYDFPELRKETLENLRLVSEKLKKSSDKDLDSYKIVFKNGQNVVEYPFWNEINGPIADALWHVGQVVTFRRSSGNPFNGKVSVLQGKLRE